MIDISALKTALATYDEIIARYDRESNDDAIRDALIQRFEYTYSLTVKILMRYVKEALPQSPDELTFNETIRSANKLGLLLSNLEKWSNYRQKRNLSSHTYNLDVAMQIVKITKDFQCEVHYLIDKIVEKL